MVTLEKDNNPLKSTVHYYIPIIYKEKYLPSAYYPCKHEPVEGIVHDEEP